MLSPLGFSDISGQPHLPSDNTTIAGTRTAVDVTGYTIDSRPLCLTTNAAQLDEPTMDLER
jgi:hypothetical protein